MVILAGKIAGDKSEFGLFTHKIDDSRKKVMLDSLVAHEVYTTKDYAQGLENMIEIFLDRNYDEQEHIYGACFGIVGQVNNNGEAQVKRKEFKATFTEYDFRHKLPYKNVPVSFINDMDAIGYGIFLGNGENEVKELYPGKSAPNPKGRRVLMLVSGGLGQALWYSHDEKKGLQPISSEEGHADFGARIDKDWELLQFLKKLKQEQGDNSPVSYEYVLSAPGLTRIYHFFQSLPEWGNQPNIDDADAIIQAAQEGNPLCKEVLDFFISIWGAQAGNLALTYKASGGVYIGGIDIPIEILKEGKFINAFIDKEGNFKAYNEGISVKVFQDNSIVMWGAARHAIEAGFVTRGRFAIMRANQ
jgi:glucokinase